MENFPSNSHKDREKKHETKPQIEKVVTGEVVVKKKSLGYKFKHIFFGGDAKSAASHIFGDVLIPAVKNMLVDATTKGIERLIYGQELPRRPIGPGRGRVSYNSISRDPRNRGYLPDQPPHVANDIRDPRDVVLASRAEAELVLEALIGIIEQYDVASIADFFDLLGLPTTHIDNKWGWTSLAQADIRQTSDGYVIFMPTAVAL